MPTSTHPTAQTGMPPRGGGRTLLHWVSISLRRGGRPCPPAGIVWFYGNPMRIRNILTGRCGHRPLQTTAENRRILKGGQSRPPLQPVLENRVWVEKSPRFPFRVGEGRCGHRPLRTTTEKRRILKGGQSRPPLQPVLENRVWVEKSPRFPFHPPPKNANTPRRDGRTLLHWVSFSRRRGRCPHRPAESTRFMVLFRRIHVDFPFCTVGADDPVRPPEMPVFTEN